MNKPLGRVVFSDEVIGDVVGCSLVDGKIVLCADVPGPHPAFNANVWRVHGTDGTVIYTVRGTGRVPIMTPAQDKHHTTHVTLPVGISGGDMAPSVRDLAADPFDRLREPRSKDAYRHAVELLTAVRADENLPLAEFDAAVSRMSWAEFVDAAGALATFLLYAEKGHGLDVDAFIVGLGLAVAGGENT